MINSNKHFALATTSLAASDCHAVQVSQGTASEALVGSGRRRLRVAGAVALLLGIHGALVGFSATLHSPTVDEPGHLVAGLVQWNFGRFDVYCVNPPLVHYLAAIPVMVVGYHPDWGNYRKLTGVRCEILMGRDFVKANGERAAWLIALARWGCLPFTWVGGLFCFFWSRELWGSAKAGFVSLVLWCFEPFVMAHAEMVTTDCAATASGLGAAFLFWRYLRRPTWRRVLAAGVALGVAELTKTTWVILFGLWPTLWLYWNATGRSTPPRPGFMAGGRTSIITTAIQLAFLLALAVYVLNLGYLFDGTFTKLGDYAFTSRALAGEGDPGVAGNRFAGTWAAKIPIPLPRDYLVGIDLQKRDFEDFGELSFLLGEWRDKGWWYYYIYGLMAKTSLGLQALFALGIMTVFFLRRGGTTWNGTASSIFNKAQTLPPIEIGYRDLTILFVPGIIVLTLVSCQTGFNHHVRYVLPSVGFAIVFAGSVACWFEPDHSFKE